MDRVKGKVAIVTGAAGTLGKAQALLLARYLRGDLDGYPPFIWK